MVRHWWKPTPSSFEITFPVTEVESNQCFVNESAIDLTGCIEAIIAQNALNGERPSTKHRWGIRDSFWDAKRVFRSNAENWDYQQEALDIERSKRPVKIRKTEELG